MPPRKKPGRKPRRTPRRKKTGNNFKRTLVLTLCFILVVIAGLYGLHFVKHVISTGSKPPVTGAQKELDVDKIESEITEGLFNLGISSKDIIGRRWVAGDETGKNPGYVMIEVDVPPGVKINELSSGLKKSLNEASLIRLDKSGPGGYVVAEIGAGGGVTHKVKFMFGSEKPASETQVSHKTPEKPQKQVKTKSRESVNKGKTALKPEPDESAQADFKDKPGVIIIVDDIGLKKAAVDDLLNIDAPLTLSVLPGLPYSVYAAEQANGRGRDVMLHLPMEPKESSGYTGQDAGENALLVGFSKKQISDRLEENLSSVPYIKGVNNHMGSKFMENRELMELVLNEIKSRGLYFVDSKTSAQSVGYETARDLGMRALERDVFLDDASKGPGYVRSQIWKMVRIAESNGYAVGICHPYPETIEVLTEMMPELEKQVQVVSVSDVLFQDRKFGKNED